MIHWELCKWLNFGHIEKWYIHRPESILKIKQKFLRDFQIQMDHPVLTRKPNHSVGRDCRIQWMNFGWGVRSSTHTNECPGYNIKQSDREAPTLETWRMWSTPSLPMLPGSLWPGVLAPDRVLSMGQIELFNHLLYLKSTLKTNDLS